MNGNSLSSGSLPSARIIENGTRQPAGHLLGKPALLIIAAAFLLSAFFGQTALVILLGLLLSATGLSRLWSRISVLRLICERILGEDHVFPGEKVILKLRVANGKALPLAWFNLDDSIPLALQMEPSLEPGSKPGLGTLSKAAALWWYSTVSWQTELRCSKRGFYTLGPLTLTTGDLFGFYPRQLIFSAIDHITVYPKIFPMAGLKVPSRYPLGEVRSEQRICEDPTRTIGVRGYTPEDSLRKVHWKATARSQDLQVKVYEPTTTLRVVIFLVMDSFLIKGVPDDNSFELGVSTAASIASHLIEQRSQVGIYANLRQIDNGQCIAIKPGGSRGHLVTILEALARATPVLTQTFFDFWQDRQSGLPPGATLIFVASDPPESMTRFISRLKESGYKVMLMRAGAPESSIAPPAGEPVAAGIEAGL